MSIIAAEPVDQLEALENGVWIDTRLSDLNGALDRVEERYSDAESDNQTMYEHIVSMIETVESSTDETRQAAVDDQLERVVPHYADSVERISSIERRDKVRDELDQLIGFDIANDKQSELESIKASLPSDADLAEPEPETTDSTTSTDGTTTDGTTTNDTTTGGTTTDSTTTDGGTQ